MINQIYVQAEQLRQEDRVGEAEALCVAIRSHQPEHEEANALLAQLMVEQGRLATAISICDRAARRQPNHLIFNMILAPIERYMGRIESSIIRCLRAIDGSPHEGWPHFYLSQGYLAADMVDKALGAAHEFEGSANREWIGFRAQLKTIASSLRRDFAAAAAQQRLDRDALARMALILAKLGKVRPARRVLRALRFEHSRDAIKARFILRRRTAGLASAVRQLSRTRAARRDVELSSLQVEAHISEGRYDRALAVLDRPVFRPYQRSRALLTSKVAMNLDGGVGLERLVWDRLRENENTIDIAQHALTQSVRTGAAPLFREPLDRGADNAGIPKRIFQFWDQPEVPSDVESVMCLWREANPDFEYVRFDDGHAQDFIASHYGGELLACYERCAHPAMRSDFIRIAYLFEKGGIYIDADEAPVGAIWEKHRAWRGARAVTPLSGTVPYNARNDFLAAQPRFPVFEIALKRAVKAVITDSKAANSNIWGSTGPGLITQALIEFLGAGGDAGGLVLISHAQYRRMCTTNNGLAYKATPAGNWRLVPKQNAEAADTD